MYSGFFWNTVKGHLNGPLTTLFIFVVVVFLFSVVALNYQTDSEPMHLNQGKFRVNGRAGYILKPKHLRDRKYFKNISLVQISKMRWI